MKRGRSRVEAAFSVIATKGAHAASAARVITRFVLRHSRASASRIDVKRVCKLTPKAKADNRGVETSAAFVAMTRLLRFSQSCVTILVLKTENLSRRLSECFTLACASDDSRKRERSAPNKQLRSARRRDDRDCRRLAAAATTKMVAADHNRRARRRVRCLHSLRARALERKRESECTHASLRTSTIAGRHDRELQMAGSMAPKPPTPLVGRKVARARGGEQPPCNARKLAYRKIAKRKDFAHYERAIMRASVTTAIFL